MNGSARSILIAGALLLLLPRSALPQARMTGADLQGAVRDITGAPLAGASIVVTNLETNLARASTADEAGRYTVPALAPGTYTVTAESPAFGRQKHQGVVLTLGQTLQLDFALAVTAGETVTVSATAPIVLANHLEVGSVINQQQIQSLPTNGRNFIGVAAIAPGVAPDHTPLQGAAATSGLTFGGQRARSAPEIGPATTSESRSASSCRTGTAGSPAPDGASDRRSSSRP